MDNKKIHNAVEYIRIQPEFPFDGVDVEDSVEGVLAYFGMHPQLDDDERAELIKELLPLAWADEEAEIAYLVESSELAGLSQAQGKPRTKSTPEGVPSFAHAAFSGTRMPVTMEGVFPFSGENAPRGD
jgi:hypothetical protein